MKLMINRLTGVEYDVLETGDNDYVYVENNSNGTCQIGCCDYVHHMIYIHKELSLVQKIKTLKHELTHAIIEEYALSNDECKLSEEKVCDFMSIYGSEIESLTEHYFKYREQTEGK